MLKQITYAILYLLFVVHSLAAQTGFGQAEKINSNWKFLIQDIPDGERTDLKDQNWQRVELPHDWSIRQPLSPTHASCMGYLPGGIAWYRKSLDIPANKKEEKVYIYFEGIYNRSEVYLNGKLLGKRPNGYISFIYDATPYIRFGEENTLAIRVDHSKDADSRWYTGSGIYRDVWLIYAHPVHIARWGVHAYPEIASREKGKLNVKMEIENGTTEIAKVSVINELFNSEGKRVARNNIKNAIPVGDSKILESSLTISNPALWNIDNPNLYRLRTTVTQNGKVIDKTETVTGFRTFTFDSDKGFALNGVWMKMKGVCLHHDGGVLGAAVPREVWKRRLQTLKEIGVNAIRTSHNPQAPHLYDLCDELGLLVMNEAFDEWEFPKRKWIEGWNRGTPGFEGSFDFFEEWAELDLADMVKRDRNHLSIFAWSIGNEVDYPNDPYSHPVLDGGGDTGFTQPIFGGYKKDAPDAMRLGDIAKKLVATVRKLDNSRPITAGLAGVAMSNVTAFPSSLDIAGYNYTESRYETDHEKYPDRVIFGSENRHDYEAWKAVRDKEFIFGQFIWTGVDYLGESGKWPSRGFYSGLLDFGGFIKPRGYFRKSLWSDEPTAYLGTYPVPQKKGVSRMDDVWSQLEAEQQGNYGERVPSMDAWPIWNYTKGQLIRVVTYTNSAKARLLLNGKEIGKTQHRNDEHGIIYWDIPYQPGFLRVEGLNESNEIIISHEIKTTRQPYAITAFPITDHVKPGEVAQIIVNVTDMNGETVMLSDNEVTCHIIGPGRLLGLEGSNNTDMTDYTDNAHRVYHGRMIAYIQATGGSEEKIQIQFTSPWLESADVVITQQK